MDVNNLGSAFMFINTCWYLTWFLLRDYLLCEGSVGTPCHFSSWVELAATWGKCCALPLLTAGLFLCCATQNGLVKLQKETTRFLSREVKVELAERAVSVS